MSSEHEEANPEPGVRPVIYRVEQYLRTSGSNAAAFYKNKALPYYQRLPGVRSVRAYQGRFGFGPTEHDIEVWVEMDSLASLDALEDYIVSHQQEVLAFEAEFDNYFEERGSRLMGDWPDPRWGSE